MSAITAGLNSLRTMRILSNLRALISDNNGAALAEYGLILGFFTGLGFLGFLQVTNTLSSLYVKIAGALGNAAAHVPATTVFFP